MGTLTGMAGTCWMGVTGLGITGIMGAACGDGRGIWGMGWAKGPPVPKSGTVVAAANISGDGTELERDDGAAGDGVGAACVAIGSVTGGGGGIVPTAGAIITGGIM